MTSSPGLILSVNGSLENALALALAADNHKVLDVQGGASAVLAALAPMPDLILLADSQGLNACAVCRVLRARPETRDIPIMILGVLHDVGQQGEAFKAGAADFVAAPIRTEELRARVRNQIDLAHGRADRVSPSVVTALDPRDATEIHEVTDLVAGQAEGNRMAAMLDGANDAIIGTTLAGIITGWNRAAVGLYGYTAEEAIGQSVDMLALPGKTQIEVAGRIRRALAGEILRADETVSVRKDGSRFDASLNISCMRDASGGPIGFMAVVSDITDRKRTEAKIRTLSRIVEQAPLSVVITDLLANIEYANPAFCGLTGYELEEVVGSNPRVLNSGLTPKQTHAELWHKLTRGEVWRGEFSNRKKNGEVYAERAVIAPVFDDQGQTTHYVALQEDITESKQSAEALRASQGRYRSILEASPDAVATTDLEGRVLFVTPTTTALFGGKQPEDLLGRPLLDFLAPEDRKRAASSLALRLQGKRIGAAEYRGLRLDGAEFDLEVNAAVRREVDGFPAEVIYIVRDITTRKEAEEALRSSDERYRAILKASPDAVIITDLEGRIVMASRMGLRMFGSDGPAGGLGRPVSDFVVPEARDRVLSDLYLMLTGRATELTEYRAMRMDGSVFDVSVNASFIRGASGHPIQVIVTIRDITTQKQSEAALAQSLREKEGLIKETHHRVKNNLALVVSLMRIGASRSAEAETKAVLKEMQTRVQSVVLLNETLYKAQNYTSVKLADYLSRTAAHAFQVLNVRPRDLRLVLELEPVEALTAQAIPCGLIVNELITNSLKHAFADGRGGEVKVALHQAAEGEALLCVSDSGAGLPRDFESRRGNSLGLQLVSDLARQIGGRLEIGEGPGAAFTISFTPARPR